MTARLCIVFVILWPLIACQQNTLTLTKTAEDDPTSQAAIWSAYLHPLEGATPAFNDLYALQPHSNLSFQQTPGSNHHPTLKDFWVGRADFKLDVQDTGLPMGESDTIVTEDGEFWSLPSRQHSFSRHTLINTATLLTFQVVPSFTAA